MPPQVSLSQAILTPFIQEAPRISLNQLSNTICQGKKRKTMTKRKLIPFLVFLLIGLSIVRLLKISIITSFSSPISTALFPTNLQPIFSDLTEKEYKFLSNIISKKAPCNLLIFGLEPQYLDLSSSINRYGTTVILEDDPKKIKSIRSRHRNTRIYNVEYSTKAGEAYKLLKNSREDTACGLNNGSLRKSSCALALKKLPKKVYKLKWDVVVVDGPRGDTPGGPGRMAVIYTARMIAQAGNMTDVVVHDMDRMIEKWFSWEFLCDENFVSSKGKFWNFRIVGGLNSSRLCPTKTIQIL